MKILLYYIATFILIIGSVSAQKTITGKIYDKETKLPLSGVTVRPNTGNPVTTDSAGHFILLHNNSISLRLSYIGYADEIFTGDAIGKGIFYLKRTEMVIDTVIVSNGYQQLPRERSTGSFDKIDNELLNRATDINVLNRLENITSGLYFSRTVGGNPELIIRGLSTLRTSSNGPLIVLDNFPYNGDINNINPNDVESITILKDAAAASIWGASAGNGVIVISTKKAKFLQPVRLSLTSTFISTDKPALYKDQAFISSSDFIEIEKFLFSKGFYDASISNTSSYPVLSPGVEILSKVRSGIISASEADAQIRALSENDIRKDYLKYLYGRGEVQQYFLGLAGGTEKISYLLNTGFDKNQTSIIGNWNRRNTFRSAINFEPIKRLEINTSFSYADSKSKRDGLSAVTPGISKANIYPYARIADNKGTPLAIVRDYRLGYVDTAGNGLLKDWHYYPLDEIKNQDKSVTVQEVLMNLAFKYQTKGLSIQLMGQYGSTHSENKDLYSSDSYFARDLINQFTNIIRNVPVLNIPDGGILDKTFSRQESYNIRVLANYTATFNEIHRVSVMAGAEARQNRTESEGGRVYGYDDHLLTYSNVDYLSEFNSYNNIKRAARIDNRKSFASITNHYLSVFGNAAYTLNQKYTFTASTRKDASNLLGVNTNQKWNPFWSTGVTWKLSDENFYNIEWMPILKPRITYGFSGNIDNSLSALAIIQYSSSSTVTGLPYALATQPTNPDLRWERTGTLNIGVDFATRKNILNGFIEYYIKRSSDLLVPVRIDPTIGSSGNLIIKNAGSMITHGIDIKLNSSLMLKKIRWETQLLFSYVRNKVLSYKFEYSDKSAFISTGININTALTKGQDPYAIISYRWGGLEHESGDPQGFLEGKLSKDYYNLLHPKDLKDLVVKGTARPPYFSSLINNFYYKGFSLSLNIIYKWGYYFQVDGIGYSALFYNWKMNTEFPERWQKPGDENHTNVPSMVYPADSYRDQFYNNSEVKVEKGDNIRLQDIRISYEFQMNSRHNKMIKGLQLFTYMNNVGIIWRANKKGIDPDYGFGLPSPHSYSLGFKANF